MPDRLSVRNDPGNARSSQGRELLANPKHADGISRDPELIGVPSLRLPPLCREIPHQGHALVDVPKRVALPPAQRTITTRCAAPALPARSFTK